MLISLLPAKLHGWLDEGATASYLAVALWLGFRGSALGVLVAGALVHFLNTRLTDYPEGTFKLYPLRIHARIELVEGAAVLAAAFALPVLTEWQRIALGVLGIAQVGAALIADLRPRGAARPEASGAQ